MLKMRGITLLAAAAIVLAGCADNSPMVRSEKDVSYGDPNAVEVATIDFGSTDLQMIAEDMSRSLAQSGVLRGRPVIQVYDVQNKTAEYIDTRSVTDSIKNQLMKAGVARFASDNTRMQSQVDQLKLQNDSGLYKESTVAKTGNMIAAKYRLEGTLTSINKKTKNIKDVYYKFTLELFDVESGLSEWMDEKEIRKTQNR